MIGAMNMAVGGMNAAAARMNVAATRIADFGSDKAPAAEDTLASDVVGMKSDQLVYNANAAVVRAADHMLGSLLDILDHNDDRHHGRY